MLCCEWRINVKTYSPDGAKAIAVYDAALNCLTSAYKQNKNNYYYYILKLQKDRLVVFVQSYAAYDFRMQKATTFRNMPFCILVNSNRNAFGPLEIWWYWSLIVCCYVM